MSLSSSFASLMFELVDQTSIEKESGIYGDLSKVCLVVSQLHRLGEKDFDSARNILRGSMKQFPDLYFLFLTDDVGTFEEMARSNVTNDEMVSIEIRIHNSYIDFTLNFT